MKSHICKWGSPVWILRTCRPKKRRGGRRWEHGFMQNSMWHIQFPLRQWSFCSEPQPAGFNLDPVKQVWFSNSTRHFYSSTFVKKYSFNPRVSGHTNKVVFHQVKGSPSDAAVASAKVLAKQIYLCLRAIGFQHGCRGEKISLSPIAVAPEQIYHM